MVDVTGIAIAWYLAGAQELTVVYIRLLQGHNTEPALWTNRDGTIGQKRPYKGRNIGQRLCEQE